MSVDGYYSCEACGTPTGYLYWSTHCMECQPPLTQKELRAMSREIMEKANAAHN